MSREYIAVVIRPGVRRSRRPLGDWACYVGTDRDEVVRKALEQSEKWGAGAYEVLVGELTHKARVPRPRFELVGLDAPREDLHL